MDFQELVKYRRSSRYLYTQKPIPDAHLRKIFEAARYAPTPHNSQPFEIIVVKDKDVIKQLSEVGFRLDKKAVDGHFYWTRFSDEELENKRTGVQVDVLPKFILDLKENPSLVDDDVFWDRAMKLYSYFVQNCSCLLFVLYDKSLRGVGPLHHVWGILSIGAVMQNIWLAANDLGISAELISGQLMVPESVQQILQILDIPKDKYRLMLIFRLGYEKKFGTWGTNIRRELKDFVHLDRFSNPF
ncbi:MAG: nitroreductase family protein [Candidatus Helarchaeota archaeon]